MRGSAANILYPTEKQGEPQTAPAPRKKENTDSKGPGRFVPVLYYLLCSSLIPTQLSKAV